MHAFDVELINELALRARPYASAILAAGKPDPSPDERLVIAALNAHRVEDRHLAFASFCRQTTEGYPAKVCDPYLGPAQDAGEIDAAWQAVHWLQSISTTLALRARVTTH